MTRTPIGRWLLIAACIFIGMSMVAPGAAIWVVAVFILLGILAWLGVIVLAPILWGIRGLSGRKMLSGEPDGLAPAPTPAKPREDLTTVMQGITLPPLWPPQQDPPVSPS